MEETLLFYAELDNNNVVTKVAVIADFRAFDSEGNIDDNLAQEFCRKMYGEENRWVRTWNDANKDIQKRFEYAGPGMQYDENLDIFYGMPYEKDWVFNTETLEWDPPADAPEKLTLTVDEIEKNYKVLWDVKKWESGEYPWHKKRIPTVEPPSLTPEEINAYGSYVFDEENGLWELKFPTSPKPELTEEDISKGATDYAWNPLKKAWEITYY